MGACLETRIRVVVDDEMDEAVAQQADAVEEENRVTRCGDGVQRGLVRHDTSRAQERSSARGGSRSATATPPLKL